MFSLNGDNSQPERFGAYDDFAATENRPVDFVPGLVSLGFIKRAVWRSARFLFVMTVLGLLIGVGAYVKSPHSYQASSSVLLTLSPYEDPQTAATNNQAIASTLAVARIAVQDLGIKQNASSFLSTYTVASNTSRLLTFTASAPSAGQAVLRASAVASAYLKFRANGLQAEQNLVMASLDQQVNQAKQRVSSIDAQINQVSSQPASPAQQSQLVKLRDELSTAEGALGSFTQNALGTQDATGASLAAALKGSEILTVAPLPHSKLKRVAIYAGIGLLAGLVLSLSVVVIRALVSDRLRRRDDVAYVLDAPVTLSVGTLRARRLLPNLPGRVAKRDRDMRRLIMHLQDASARSTQGPAGLAIVAVDNGPIVARAVAALATTYASQGNQVITADLSAGADMARLFGVKSPGIHAVSHNGANFTLALPDRDDPAPVGPRHAVISPGRSAQAGDALVASYASADVLLSLVTLDPARAADYLATWATSAVVVVSAGRSSADRIRGVGEMIRHAGTRLDSVVLIDADRSDESLGLARRSDEQAGIGVLSR
jgi:capsular polysaccharide biosynthesis protein